jgi:hypothetical protein
MPPLLPYLPVVLFGAWAVYGAITLPNWRDARYVRRPERQFWGFWHVLNSAEWTEDGLRLRRRYFRHVGIGLLLGLVGILIVKAVEAQPV